MLAIGKGVSLEFYRQTIVVSRVSGLDQQYLALWRNDRHLRGVNLARALALLLGHRMRNLVPRCCRPSDLRVRARERAQVDR